MHYSKVSQRLENLLGALAVGLSDAISSAVETTAGHAGAIGAALATLAQEPGLSIEQLRVPLGRTQSATVRVVDQLAAEGYAERRPGATSARSRWSSRRRACRPPAGCSPAGTGAQRRRWRAHPGERKTLTAALEKVLTRDDHGPGPCRPDLPPVRPRRLPATGLPRRTAPPVTATAGFRPRCRGSDPAMTTTAYRPAHHRRDRQRACRLAHIFGAAAVTGVALLLFTVTLFRSRPAPVPVLIAWDRSWRWPRAWPPT